MRKFLLLMALAAIAAGVFAGTASAKRNPDGYYLSKHYARTYTKQMVRDLYPDITSFATACRPQYEKEIPTYWYHRWVCGWADDQVGGVILIIGGSGKNFHYRILKGLHEF